MRTVVALFVVLAVSSALAEKQPLERYQTIIDRQMFGPLPPGFDPSKLPSEVQKSSASEKELTKEQEQLKSAIHFSVINVTADGQAQVGFTDNSNPKAPKNYFLKVGESRDGWTVKEADAEKATMTIAKDEIEVSLTLGGNSANTAAATSRAGTAPQNSMRQGLHSGGSLLSRRMQRRQAEAAAQAVAAEKAAAAAAEKEAERQAQAEQEKQQREAERAEQRQQLLAIQEELKRVREQKAEAAKQDENGNAQNDSE